MHATALPVDDLPALLAGARAALADADHRDGLALARRARRAAADEPAQQLAEALVLEGRHLWRLGQFEEAALAGRQAAQVSQQHGLAAGQAEALCLLAAACAELGLPEEGLKNAGAALEIARQHGHERLVTLALNRLGVCHERLGDLEQGERLLLQALSRAREQGDLEDTLAALNNLSTLTLAAFRRCETRGDTAAAQQALQRARRHAEQGLAMARRERNRYAERVTQGTLAEVLTAAGETEAAERLLAEAMAQARQHGWRAVEMRSRHRMAELRQQQGLHEEAVQCLHTLLDALSAAPDDDAVRGRTLSSLHRSYKALGRHEAALAHFEPFHALEMQRAARRAQAQSHLMVNRHEMEQALQMADHALMDAARQRMKAGELQAEKRALEARSKVLHRNAYQDPLTGLDNRRRLDEALPRLMEQAQAQRQPLQLAMLDVDWFKQVNDQFGHAVGDAVLRDVAHILRERLRTRDLAVRLGGEEFVVVLVDSLPAAALEVCERLRLAVQGHAWGSLAAGLAVTLSIGLTPAAAGDAAARLLERADEALYRAKHAGRNRVHVDD